MISWGRRFHISFVVRNPLSPLETMNFARAKDSEFLFFVLTIAFAVACHVSL